MTATDAIILITMNLFWGYIWFQIGRITGRKEAGQ